MLLLPLFLSVFARSADDDSVLDNVNDESPTLDDDDTGFGWGDEDDVPKEIDWPSVPVTNALILGSGPAGSTAALYLSRAGHSPLVLHGMVPGGQLMYTTAIENFPGFRGTGPALVKAIQEQAEEAGARYELDQVKSVNLSVFPYRLETEKGNGYRCKALIVATGAQAKYLGLESEQRLRGRGVSACAVCDGRLFSGLPVAVVGGGDTAIEEALYLAPMCGTVTLVHRGQLSASKPMRARLAKSNVTVIGGTVVTEVIGDDFVTGLQLKDQASGAVTTIDVRAMFVAIGRVPATEAFVGQLEMDAQGYFATQGTPETKLQGVFVAGDCADPLFRQAIVAAGSGCQAALLAEKYLARRE
jgi:thioredoxin reductase (NADPH)